MKHTKIFFSFLMAFLLAAASSCSDDGEPKIKEDNDPYEELSTSPKIVKYNTGDNTLGMNLFQRVVWKDSFQYENKKVVYNLRKRTSGTNQEFAYTYKGDTTIAIRNNDSKRYSVQYNVTPDKEYMEFPTFPITAILVTEKIGNKIIIWRFEYDDELPTVYEIENVGYMRYIIEIHLDAEGENIDKVKLLHINDQGVFSLHSETYDFEFGDIKNPFLGIRKEFPYFTNMPLHSHVIMDKFLNYLPKKYTVKNYWNDNIITYAFDYQVDDHDRLISSRVSLDGSEFVPDIELISYK